MNAYRLTIAAAVAVVLCLAGAGTSLAVNTGDASARHAVLDPGTSASGGLYILTGDGPDRSGADAVEMSGDGYILDFHAARAASAGAAGATGESGDSRLTP